MKELSLFDKFGILFDNILDHPLFVVLFFVPIVLFFLRKKHGNKVYIIMYFISIVLVLLIGGNELFKIFDNFMDGLFMVLYFPNFITLFVVILLNALFAFVSIFSKDIHKINRAINYIFFFIIQSLFVLVVLVIRSNDLNIYKDNALYSNSDVLSLMQILIGAFGIQMISLLIINLINRVTSILDRKESDMSNSINEQIKELENSKNVNDINDVGFINVANKTKSSKPILKPFKFDLDKLQMIRLETNPKVLTSIKLKNKKVSYLNEVIKPRKWKIVVLDCSKFVKLIGFQNPVFKNVILNYKDVSYLNEIVKVRKFKPYKLNTMKEIYLNMSVLKTERLFRNITLNGSDVSYLDEKVKNYRFVDINSNKRISMDVGIKPYNSINLSDNNFTYLNEIFNSSPINNKGFKKINLSDSNFSYMHGISNKYKVYRLNFDNIVNMRNADKIQGKYKSFKLDNKKASNVALDVKPKKYNFISLKNKIISYFNDALNKPVKLDSKKINEANKPYDSVPVDDKSKFIEKESFSLSKKPDLMKPMIPSVTDKSLERAISVENLRIIDMQSVVDVVSKYHFYKGVCLEGSGNVDAVDNLKILNFELLSNVLIRYKIIKR